MPSPFRGHPTRRATIVFASVSLLLLLRAEPATSNDCYQTFLTAYGGLREALATRFGGTHWRMEDLRSPIRDELTEIGSESDSLMTENRNLNARKTGVESDLAMLQMKIDANSRARVILAQQHQTVSSQLAQITLETSVLQEKIGKHNAVHPTGNCEYPKDNPGVCMPWVNEAQQLNAESAALDTRNRAALDNDHELSAKDAELAQDVTELASQQNVLDQTKQHVADDESAFTAECTKDEQHVRAMIEVIDNPRQKLGRQESAEQQEQREQQAAGNKIADSLATDVMKGVASGAFAALFSKLKLDEESLGRLSDPAAGVAITTLDVIAADMDDHATEVANNTYLLGAYGAALTHLKQEGRLRPGDQGYDALASMNRELGNRSPASGAEFTWQSFGTRNYIRNAVEGYAGDMVNAATGASESVAKLIMQKGVTAADRKVIGKTGLAVFEKSLDTIVAWGSNKLGVEAPIEFSAEYVEKRRREAAEHSLKDDK